MARVNINILGISELKWTRTGEFNSDDHYIYYYGQESLKEVEQPSQSTKEYKMQYLDVFSKMKKMISVHFQGKPFNITVIQVYAPTTKVKEAEVDWFYEDPQDLPELKHTHTHKCPFHYKGLECKSRKSRDT